MNVLEVVLLALAGVLFMALVAGLVYSPVLMDEESPEEHDPHTCWRCAELRHPSRAAVRKGVTRIPGQGRRGVR